MRVGRQFAIGLIVLAGASQAEAKRSHVVSEGDTLWDISRSYGCEVDDIRQSNRLRGSFLSVGQTLDIPSCESSKSVDQRVAVAPQTKKPKSEGEPLRLVEYRIQTGDTLGAIATRFDSSVEDIMQRNGLGSTTIFPGKTLDVAPGIKEGRLVAIPGQSVGRPQRGRLVNATRLARAPHYFIRRPERAFGAHHTVKQVERVAKRVKKLFPRTHKLAIGDISAQKGGKITMHASHQSGRDVDLGFYFKKKPAGYPQSFKVVTPKNMHFKANWEMIRSLASTADQPGGVERIFMSYGTQRMFYNRARKAGIKKSLLDELFQFPHGRGSPKGIIRHEPGHDEHIHVRFKCPPKDKRCL